MLPAQAGSIFRIMVSALALLLIAFGYAPARGDLVDAGSVLVDVNTESLVVGSTPATLTATARNLLLAGGPWSRPWTGAAGGERGLHERTE